MTQTKRSELGDAIAEFRTGLVGVAVLSAVLNFLALTSSIYLMLVYDRVLPSARMETLYSLLMIVTVVYLFYGAFDITRSRLLSDIGAALDRSMAGRVQQLETHLALRRPRLVEAASPIRDLDQIRGFLSGAGPAALIDLPWVVFFLGVLSFINIWLGVVTLAGAIVLACLTWATERITKQRVAGLATTANERRVMADSQRRHVEVMYSLGMRGRMEDRWTRSNNAYLDAQSELTSRTVLLGGIAKVFRVFLQSLVLSVGAILVIRGEASGGIIFASSILAGRALAPVDQAIASWRGFVGARQSWARLSKLLNDVPLHGSPATLLPLPSKSLTVQRLTLTPPDVSRAVVVDATFQASAGDAIGILGASACGKSSLLRGVIGAWHPARGEVRLDGAKLEQWDGDLIGQTIGYLPQTVELFTGSVADNIARFDPNAPSEAVIAAATAAGIHETILQLPEGYATQVGDDGQNVSAGQRQRIGLARALYGDPFLVVLDEPNSNLDPAGEEALARAIIAVRKRGGIVLVAAHRTSILKAVNLVLLMHAGQTQGFGPRDEMLAKVAEAQNKAVRPSPKSGAGALAIVPKDG